MAAFTRLVPLALIALAATACGGSSGAGAGSSPSSSPSSSPTPTPTVTTTTTTTAAPGLCADGSIETTQHDGGAGAGHVGLILLFRNTGGADCILRGYPGVTPYVGTEQGTPASRTLQGYLGGTTRISDVLLRPDAQASARVEGTDAPSGNNQSCPSYTKLVVTPPNLHDSATLQVKFPGCSRLQVHPVVDGTRGTTS